MTEVTARETGEEIAEEPGDELPAPSLGAALEATLARLPRAREAWALTVC